MPRYLRPRMAGNTFFFTVVSFGRRKIFATNIGRRLLARAMVEVRSQYPFSLEAWVLLPDHLHTLWILPEGDTDFSKRWGLIKANFSRKAKPLFDTESLINPSRKQRRETTIWQRRFWEHVIRDKEDFQKHLDYIHYNPVKHGLVRNVRDWPYSSFHRFVTHGFYPEHWGSTFSFNSKDVFGE
jgi:putative transposase